MQVEPIQNGQKKSLEETQALARNRDLCSDPTTLGLKTLEREHSMKLVEKHCSKYLEMFGECIQRYPHTWQMDCEPERRKLAKCAETNPEILHIKTVCGTQFHVYEKCMADFQTDTDKCLESFNVFSACADQAMASFASQGSNPLSSPQDKLSVRKPDHYRGNPDR